MPARLATDPLILPAQGRTLCRPLTAYPSRVTAPGDLAATLAPAVPATRPAALGAGVSMAKGPAIRHADCEPR